MPKATPQRYRVLSELMYSDIRVLPGMVVDSILPQSVGWLLEQGHIEKTDDPLEGEPEPAVMPEAWIDTETGKEVSS